MPYTPDQHCTFDGCEKQRMSRLWCGGHYKQSKKYGEVFPLGDKARRAAMIKEAWARLSDSEKKARLAPMMAGVKGVERSAQHRQRLSESIRAAHAKGDYWSPRTCRSCDAAFEPTSGHQWYCSRECKVVVNRLKRHGITATEYLDMFTAQGGVCALCLTSGRGFSGSKYPLVIDHCHDTKKVRGLLCPDCNTALGRFGDDPIRLRAAAGYIERTCPH